MTVAAAAFRPPSSLPSSLAAGLHRLPAPATEPPYDEHPVPRPTEPTAATQGTLALTFTLPSGVATEPRPALRLVPDPVQAPPDTAGLPAVKAWADTLAMAIAQVLTGERTPGQLRQWAMPEVFDVLARRAALATQAPRRRASLRAVHLCCPARGIAEISTVVHGLARPKALAFRLEARRTRWVCTALELG